MQTVKRILLTACVLIVALGPLQAQNAGDEQRLKAAFVFRFPQFVVWPPASMARTSLEICVTAPRAAAALREITAGELLNGKPFSVRETPSARDLASCHVLVMTGAPADRGLMTTAAALPILTVGDSDSFLDRGGIIRLKVVDRRVRFDIDQGAATRAGLTLSSQLLRLAATVRSEQ